MARRATRSGDDDGIEVLASRPDAFRAFGAGYVDVVDGDDGDDGEGSPDADGVRDDGMDTSGHRRRRRVLTALGAVAAVGVGAALVAPNGDDAARPAVTAPRAPGAEDGSTPTSVGSNDAAGTAVGYVLDPAVAAAAGFVPVGGLSPSAPRPDPSGRMRLWATQGASRTFGTWVAVQRTDEPARPAVQDAARIPVGDVDALVVVEPDGVVTLDVPTTDGTSLLLTSYGIGPADLVDLAAALRATSAEGEAEVLSADPYGDQGPLHLLLDRPSTGHGLGQDLLTAGVEATAFYRDAAGRIVSVTTSPRDPELEGVLAPFVLRGLGAAGTRSRILTSGDIGMGDHPALGAQHVVSFTAGAATVRLSSSRSDVDLEALAAATMEGDDDAWSAVQARGRGFVDGRGLTYTTAGSGTFAGGASWTLSLASGPRWGSFFVAEGDGTGTFAELYLDRSPCATVTTTTATTVACVRPTGDAPTELLVGAADAGVPFEPVDGGWSIAVARVEQVGALPLLEAADGRAAVTLGHSGGDSGGWARWAALDPAGTDPAGAATAADATGWVVDGGIPGLTPLGASNGQPAEPIGTLAIWGTPDSTRATGTWVAIAAARGGGVPPLAEDAVRVRIETAGGDIPALLQTSRDGVVTLQWSTLDAGEVTAVARGIALDRFLALAAGVHVGDEPTTGLAIPLLDVAPTADDGTPLGELARLPTTTLLPEYLGLDLGTQWTYHVDALGAVQVQIGVRETSPQADVAAGLLLGPAPAGDPPVDLAGLDAVVSGGVAGTIAGAVEGQPALRVLRARFGDAVVTFVSRLPLATVVPALGGLRPSPADEWAALLLDGADWQASAAATARATMIGAGPGTDDSLWMVAMQDVFGLVGVHDDASWWLSMEPSADRPIHVLRSTDTTFVVALLPAQGDATGLQVTVDGEDPVVVPLTPSTSGATTWVGAAYAVDAADEATLHVELV